MQTLAQRIMHWADVEPTRLAIDDGIAVLTYGELREKSTRVAYGLQQLGVKPKDRVVILLPKSVDALCAIIGTLLAGATYIPVDIGSPRSRLHSILTDANANAIIVNNTTADWFPEVASFNVTHISHTPHIFAQLPAQMIFPCVDMATDAYILYTSGSTGIPNGVRISHTAMHAFFAAVNCHMGIARNSRCMNTSALYFDVSVADILLPLYQGAAVWLGPNIPLPLRFLDIISTHRITHFCAVGSTLTMLSSIPGFEKNSWEHIACIMTGAEVLNPNAISAWLAISPNAIIINGYGPTEVTCVCTLFEITKNNVANYLSFPIGIPLPNVNILIDGNEADASGELCVSGPQVMNGYLKREELNQLRLFVKGDTTFYRTGDKVKYDGNGNLIFLGRIDDQIKVNGYRVHLGEVAEPFRNAEGVQDAIALVLKHARYGECLAIVVKPKHQSLNLAELKKHCSNALPSYMKPALIAQINCLPLSPSGKVNAKKIRAIAIEHFANNNAEVSIIESAVEEVVA
jgi:amino acid adenylation domain-containing protein